MEELRKQESRTYERLYTPPEVDDEDDVEVEEHGDKQQRMTENMIAKMMKIKKQAVDAEKAEERAGYKETKEFRHL